MSCLNCTKTKPVLNCITNLVIGTISSVSTAVYVYLQSAATGKTSRYAVTSSNAGLVTIALGQAFNAEQDYEVWVTLQTATNVDEREIILVEDTEHDCLLLNFARVYKNDNTSATATTQTLSI